MYCDLSNKTDMDVSREEEDSGLAPMPSEAEWAIKSIKGGKSPGCDNIWAEMIKASVEAGVKFHHQSCVEIWNTGIWPVDWKRSIFILLPKKGDLQLCSN